MPLFLALALLLAGPARAEPEPPAPPPVVFLSDFGTGDEAVAAVKGVMLGIDPRLQVIDLTHQVRPYAIADGARLLADTAPFYPKGTVFLAVIDPGVGGTRKPMVARSSRGQWFVLPDNGLITMVAERDGLESAREITNPAWLRDPAVSSTFHGRDVSAPPPRISPVATTGQRSAPSSPSRYASRSGPRPSTRRACTDR